MPKDWTRDPIVVTGYWLGMAIIGIVVGWVLGTQA